MKKKKIIFRLFLVMLCTFLAVQRNNTAFATDANETSDVNEETVVEKTDSVEDETIVDDETLIADETTTEDEINENEETVDETTTNDEEVVDETITDEENEVVDDTITDDETVIDETDANDEEETTTNDIVDVVNEKIPSLIALDSIISLIDLDIMPLALDDNQIYFETLVVGNMTYKDVNIDAATQVFNGKDTGANSENNRYTFFVGDTIDIYANVGSNNDYKFVCTESSDEVLEETSSSSISNAKLSASYLALTQGTSEIALQDSEGHTERTFYITVRNPILVNTSNGEYRKDTVHEYLIDALGEKDSHCLIYTPDGRTPLYVKNLNENDCRYCMVTGQTVVLSTYASKANETTFQSDSSNLVKDGDMIVTDYGDRFKRIEQTFILSESAKENDVITVSFGETNFYIEVNDINSSDKFANHFDIEIGDGGTYVITEYEYYADGSYKEIITTYFTYVSGINLCQVFDENDECKLTLNSDQYTAMGAGAQVEFTSAWYTVDGDGYGGVRGTKLSPSDVKKVIFDVQLTLIEPTQTTTLYTLKDDGTYDKGIEDTTSSIPADKQEVKIPEFKAIMNAREILDAFNKCPNHLGYDFTLKGIAEVENSAPGNLQVTKTVTGNAGDKTKDFNFKITLTGTYYDNSVLKKADEINGKYGDFTFEKGVAFFTLRHDETKTATGLPSGIHYEIEEIDSGDYKVKASGTIGSIPTDDTTSAVVENHMEVDPNIEILKRQAVNVGTDTVDNDVNGWNQATTELLPVVSGDEVTYYLQITSTGTTVAKDVIVTDTIPTDTAGINEDGYLGYVDGSASDGGVYDLDTHTITWELGDMEPNEVRIVSFKVNNIPDVRERTIWDNMGAASFDNPLPNDPNDPNNPDNPNDPNGGRKIRKSNKVEIVSESDPDVEILKRQAINVGTDIVDNDVDGWDQATAELLPVVSGDEVTYYLQIISSGTTIAKNVVVSDIVPIDTSGINEDGYLGYVEGSASDGGVYDPDTHTITWELGDMEPGDIRIVSFKVNNIPEIQDKTIWDNMAAVAFDNPHPNDPNDPNNPDDPNDPNGGRKIRKSNKVEIVSESDPLVEISKKQAVNVEGDIVDNDIDGWENATIGQITVRKGDEVTYYLQITSIGTTVAKDVIVTDVMPEDSSGQTPDGYLEYLEDSASDGGVYDPDTHTITWELGDMEPGESVVVSFRVHNIPDVHEKVTWRNIASISYSNPNPDDDMNVDRLGDESNLVELIPVNAPKTGDHSQETLWTEILLMSVVGMLLVTTIKKRNELLNNR